MVNKPGFLPPSIRLDKIENTLDIDGDTGLCKTVENQSKDIDFFKRFIKFAAWGIGISVGILITIFSIVLKLNIDLIQQIATLSAQIISHTGG